LQARQVTPVPGGRWTPAWWWWVYERVCRGSNKTL